MPVNGKTSPVYCRVLLGVFLDVWKYFHSAACKASPLSLIIPQVLQQCRNLDGRKWNSRKGKGLVNASLKRKNSSPSFSSSSWALNLSGEGTRSRLDSILWSSLFFSLLLPWLFPFVCLAYSLYSRPGTIYHVAISKVPSPFLAGKPLERLCIVAARLHSGPHLRHLSSFVLTFYLPVPRVKSYLQCPLKMKDGEVRFKKIT